jgi:hypothetical protein
MASLVAFTQKTKCYPAIGRHDHHDRAWHHTDHLNIFFALQFLPLPTPHSIFLIILGLARSWLPLFIHHLLHLALYLRTLDTVSRNSSLL